MNTPVVVKLWLRSQGLFSFLQLVQSTRRITRAIYSVVDVSSDVISDDLIGLFFLRAYGPKDSGAENQ
jgi:hypothetical protein